MESEQALKRLVEEAVELRVALLETEVRQLRALITELLKQTPNSTAQIAPGTQASETANGAHLMRTDGLKHEATATEPSGKDPNTTSSIELSPNDPPSESSSEPFNDSSPELPPSIPPGRKDFASMLRRGLEAELQTKDEPESDPAPKKRGWNPFRRERN